MEKERKHFPSLLFLYICPQTVVYIHNISIFVDLCPLMIKNGLSSVLFLMPSLISHVEVIQPFEVIPTAEFRHPLTSK
jgi:hypothetical protein